MSDLALACSCGNVRGVLRDVAPERGNHLVCYCDDCQAFAHALGAAEAVLDAHGGTEIFQTSPARLSFEAGVEQLACLRLRPNGLLRWYAGCCASPLANTQAGGAIPFVGVVCGAILPSDEATAALGPIRARVNARFARGDRAGLDAHDGWSVPMIGRFARIVLGAWLRGDAKRSPFFDAATGSPVAAPRVLGDEELERALAGGAGASGLR